MCTITPEDAYKAAVKKKYEEVKEGVNFVYLNSPTRAKLSNLCWEIFAGKEMHQDDLKAFNSLLEMPFDLSTKNTFRKKIDRFRPVENFFKGETNPANIDSVDVAAILVDYKPRPFNKFRIKFLSGELNAEDNEEADSSGRLEPIKKSDKEIITEKQKNKSGVIISKNRNRFFERLFNRSKPAMLITAVIFCLIAATIYLAFIKKNCMQWSEDHYEIVDCDAKAEDGSTIIIPLNKDLLDFRKVKVCDTTTCFNKNGDPFIWYSKHNNRVEFFNTHGNHPINNKPLRAITPYIFKKYSENCTSKK